MGKKWKIVQNFDFFRFSRFFLRRYIPRIFVKLFFVVHLLHINEHKEFQTYRLEPTRNNIRASWTKMGNRPKFWLFTIFTNFFTTIYSADFCETFFIGSPTPYERIQGVSYLQLSAISACARVVSWVTCISLPRRVWLKRLTLKVPRL